MCLKVPKANLADYNTRFKKKRRLEIDHLSLLQELNNPRTTKKRRKDILSDYSVQPHQSALSGFVDGASDQGSYFNAFAYDSMHIEDLGTFLYIVHVSKEYLKQKYDAAVAQAKLDECNTRLCALMNLVRAEDFSLPDCEDGYFPAPSLVQAKNHRNVMQVLPHIFHGVDQDLALVAIRCVLLFMQFRF